MADTQAVAVQDAANPLVIVEKMIDKGVGLEELRGMMALAEDYRKTKAAEKFSQALTRFQAKCPMIHKGRAADRYAFASYDDIWAVAGPIAAECELSVSFSFPKAENGHSLTVCHLRVGSHVEDRPFSIPIADMQAVLQDIANKTKITLAQAYGFWLSYQKRYSLSAALNIVVTNEDNDCRRTDTITEEQAQEFTRQIAMFSDRGESFIKWLKESEKVDSVAKIAAARHDFIATTIQKALDKQKARKPAPAKGDSYEGV